VSLLSCVAGVCLDLSFCMADPPEFLGFVRYDWFTITEPGFEPTQWVDSFTAIC
ncbi:MAG: hypothetical protein EZS28_038290, partial [Streblomastix strix]